MQIADVGRDVWVGNSEACDARLGEFALSVHVHHPYHWPTGVCQAIRAGQCPGLVVCYLDGDDLRAKCVPPLDAIAAYVWQPGKLLIHCAHGTYRGPTLAVLALVVRGADPFDAIRDVTQGTWRQYGVPQVSFLNSVPIRNILEWRAEHPRGKRAMTLDEIARRREVIKGLRLGKIESTLNPAVAYAQALAALHRDVLAAIAAGAADAGALARAALEPIVVQWDEWEV